MRLIDADALFTDLDGTMAVSPTGYIHGDTVADMIGDQPTFDAVPVIRCKDCKHRYSTCPMITIHPTGSLTFRAQDDWFCFMGERKEECY